MRTSSIGIFALLCSLAVPVASYLEMPLTWALAAFATLMTALALWGQGNDSQEMSAEGESSEYEIVGKLGEGGMGEVFAARQIGLRRVVALKSIKPLQMTEEERSRFRREARVLSSLSNPHTINVFDAGIRRDGSFYYVMELLDGLNLEQLIERQGPVSAGRAIHILKQAARSLAEAHAKGLVHRDLKPANLMVCRYGGEFDFVKVLDFGLVKVGLNGAGGTDGNSEDSQASEPAKFDSMEAITSIGALPGTPAFLAPESILGSSFVDHRADIYSLGAVAYFILTGRFLFDLEKPIAMIQAQLKQTPPLVSEHSPTELPEDLVELLRCCLEKDPALRPQSAVELLHRLEELSLIRPWSLAQAKKCWDDVPVASAQPEPRLPSDATGQWSS